MTTQSNLETGISNIEHNFLDRTDNQSISSPYTNNDSELNKSTPIKLKPGSSGSDPRTSSHFRDNGMSII